MSSPDKQKIKTGDVVWYGSLGDGVEFEVIDRCVSGKFVLKTIKSAYQYDGGWPIGRLMLADKVMLRRVERHREISVTLRITVEVELP